MPSFPGRFFHGIRAVIIAGRLAACCLMLLAASCAGGQPPAEEPDELGGQIFRGAAPPAPVLNQTTQASLDLGRAMLLRGNFNEAQVYFKRALETAQQTLGQTRATIGMAWAALDQGNLNQAKDWLKHVAAMDKEGAEVLQADWLEAKIMSKQGDRAAVAEALRRFASRPILGIPIAEQANAASYLADQMALGRGDSALLNTLLYSARRPGSLAGRDLPDWIAFTAAQLPAGQVAALVKLETDDDLRAALIAGLARGYLKDGDVAEAKQATTYLAALPLEGRWRAWVQAMREDLSRGPVLKNHSLGVVLPLSGPQAIQGRRVLLAIKLALGALQEPDKALALHVMDSRSQALAADQAVKELVERHKATIIIGPLDTMAALAAARRAQSLETPIICLNSEEDLARVGSYVFRNYPTPADQVAAIMPKVSDEGSSRVAILAPDDKQGRSFAIALQDWFKARRTSQSKTFVLSAGQGLRLSSSVFYSPGGGAWRASLEQLVKPPSGKLQGGRPLINFDRLWLTGPSEDVERLVPRLRHYDVRGKQLLGTMQWHSRELLAKVGTLLEGSVFCDAFDPASNREQARGFSQSFEREAGREPGMLEALGYDSALLVKSVLKRAASASSRPELRLALTKLKNLEGACGKLSMGPDRRLRMPMKIFSVRQGDFVSLGVAPE